MRGSAGSEPDGMTGDAFFILAMYDTGTGLTLTALHDRMRAELAALHDPVPSRRQLRDALSHMARQYRPLVERAGPARKGVEPTWRITSHGRVMLARWCGDEPAAGFDRRDERRVVSGLGWPEHAINDARRP